MSEAVLTIEEIDGIRITPEKVPALLEANSMAEQLKHFVGHRIVLCAARYHWRGIVKSVTKDSILLDYATQIDVTGACGGSKPTSEDEIGGPILINLNAIETVYQPNFVFAPLPGEPAE